MIRRAARRAQARSRQLRAAHICRRDRRTMVRAAQPRYFERDVVGVVAAPQRCHVLLTRFAHGYIMRAEHAAPGHRDARFLRPTPVDAITIIFIITPPIAPGTLPAQRAQPQLAPLFFFSLRSCFRYAIADTLTPFHFTPLLPFSCRYFICHAIFVISLLFSVDFSAFAIIIDSFQRYFIAGYAIG